MPILKSDLIHLLIIAGLVAASAGSARGQRSTRLRPPPTASVQPPQTEREILASLTPRTLSVVVTLKGGGEYETQDKETVTWSVNRTYASTVLLNNISAICTPLDKEDYELAAFFKEPVREVCSVMIFNYDPDKPDGMAEISSQINVNDRRVTVSPSSERPKEGEVPQPVTTTHTLVCDTVAKTLNLASVSILPHSKKISLSIPFLANTRGGGQCEQRTTVRGRRVNPPDSFSLTPTPPGFPEAVDAVDFEGNPQGVTVSLGKTLAMQAATGFTFTSKQTDLPSPILADSKRGKVALNIKYTFSK